MNDAENSPPSASPAPRRSRFKFFLAVAGGLFLVLVAGVLGVAAMQPDIFRVQRSIVIDAPPEAIFPLLNDYKLSQQWSPYEDVDPDMKRTFRGPERGEGAVYEWDGDANVGAGRLEITESVPPQRVKLNLNMSRPFECRNVVVYSLEPAGESTRMTWSMEGPSNLISKAIGLFIDMDAMVGGQMERGLHSLKALMEKP